MDNDIVSGLYVLSTALAYCIPTFIALVRGASQLRPDFGRESFARVDSDRLGGSVGLVVNEAT